MTVFGYVENYDDVFSGFRWIDVFGRTSPYPNKYIYIYIYFFQSKVKIYGSFRRKKFHFRFRKKSITRKHFGSTSPYPNIYRFSNVNRIFKTILDNKRVASSLEKGRLFVKCTLAQRIFYLSGNDSSRKIQLYPNLWAWTKMKL